MIYFFEIKIKSAYLSIFRILQICKLTCNVFKRIIKIILFLNLITNQQPFLTKKQKNNIFLKVKKNSIIGCKITLRKEYIYIFLEKIIFYILPNLKKIKFNMIKIKGCYTKLL